MVAFPVPGAYFNDPRLLPRWLITSANVSLVDSATTSASLEAAGTWTEIGVRGVAVDTNWTAATKKTLLTVNGPAVLEHIIGPTSAAADTDIFEIVVDGVTWTSPTFTSAAGKRIVLGYLASANFFGTTATSNFLWQASVAAQNSTNGLRTNNNGILIPSSSLEMLGTPFIWARNSLVVSITHSANLTTTTNNERQAGVIYRPL